VQSLMKRSLGSVLQLLSVAVLFVMLVPQPGMPQSPLPDVQTLCQPLEIHKGAPDEQACLKELAGAVRRDGAVLTLGLNNGKTKIMSDTKECGADTEREADCVMYRLMGHIGDRQFIVLVEPYECAYVLLVSRRTGEETPIGGWPHLSPNKKRFVVADTRDAGNCAPDYAVAIFSLARDPPRLEGQFKPEGFGPYDVDAWNGESRVQLSVVDAEGKRAITDLTLTAQGWQLKLPNGQSAPSVPSSPARPNAHASPTGLETTPAVVPLNR
jgi:hypothetical protein